MKTQLKGSVLLLLTALIWGSAFVAQSVGMDYVGPFTFNSVRCIIGGIVLLPCIALLDKMNGRKISVWGTNENAARKTLVAGGVLCGVLLAIASSFQQMGIQYTTVGKSGFITAMYILIVPILGLFAGKKVPLLTWGGVGLAVVGLYLLCMTDGFALSAGDVLMMACAFSFSFHIMVVDKYSPMVDGVRMSCIQFFVCGILCGIPALMFESPQLAQIIAAAQPILYAGVMSCGVAYTLQIIGQKYTQPTVASLLMSLESVFAVICGAIILHETMNGREIFGCVLMFAAIVFAQIPTKAKSKA